MKILEAKSKGEILLYKTPEDDTQIDVKFENFLYEKDGRKRIADNAIVALCLLIAESNPKEKDMIVNVVINLINKKS